MELTENGEETKEGESNQWGKTSNKTRRGESKQGRKKANENKGALTRERRRGGVGSRGGSNTLNEENKKVHRKQRTRKREGGS